MFQASELQRVSEFFDGDMPQTYRFIGATWLPDARKTLGILAATLGFRDLTRALFLCDHLREGARTVGALLILDLANSIEHHLAGLRFEQAEELVWDGIVALRKAEAKLPMRP